MTGGGVGSQREEVEKRTSVQRFYKRAESLYAVDARKVVGEDASADWLPRSVYTALVFS